MPKPPSFNQRTKPELEKQVVALIAAGRRYADISEETGVAVSTIKKIKRRNPTTLAKMQDIITVQHAKIAARIHQKSLKEISKKLDRVEAGKEEIAIKDLVAVSKEMFNQSQIEEGNPTEISQSNISPMEQKEYLTALMRAIEANDTVAMQRIVWPSETKRRTDLD